MAYVISDGQLAGIDRPRPPVASPRIELGSGHSATYAQLWRTQPHVRTVIDFLARNVAQIGLHVFERVDDVDRRRLTDHPLAALIRKPNEATTRYRLMDTLVHDLGIYDVACWAKMAGPQLVRLPPSKIEPIGDSWLWAEGVRMKGAKSKRDFGRDEIVLFHGYDPDDARWGVSPMETLRRVLAEEWAATQYREQLWRNGARFPGYIKRPKEAGDWSETARSRFREDWRGLYTGDGPGAGGTPILEDGMEFVGGGITPVQAQYLETRKLTREEVAAAFHIPQPMVGILDHATFSNIAEQHKHLYQDTLGPWLEMIQQEVELQLVPDFDKSGRVYVEFNLADKMKGSFEEQAAAMQTMVGAPVMTRNEGRSRLNLPQIAGGDDLVTPLNVLVGGQASPTDSAPPGKAGGPAVKARAPETHEAKYSEVLRQHFEAQRAGLAARPSSWPASWDARLAADLARLHAQTAETAGQSAISRAGGDPDEYDRDRTIAYLSKRAKGDAQRINGFNKQRVIEALADVSDEETDEGAINHVFDVADKDAASLGRDMVTALSAWGVIEGGRQTGAGSKTWRVTSSNPRDSHAALDGETVPLDDNFSNGLKWPGDGSSGDADELAGCTCELEINF